MQTVSVSAGNAHVFTRIATKSPGVCNPQLMSRSSSAATGVLHTWFVLPSRRATGAATSPHVRAFPRGELVYAGNHDPREFIRIFFIACVFCICVNRMFAQDTAGK